MAKALRIEFDVAAQNAAQPDEESLMLGGKPAVVHPASGQWMSND